jgi:hypothetical protein
MTICFHQTNRLEPILEEFDLNSKTVRVELERNFYLCDPSDDSVEYFFADTLDRLNKIQSSIADIRNDHAEFAESFLEEIRVKGELTTQWYLSVDKKLEHLISLMRSK